LRTRVRVRHEPQEAQVDDAAILREIARRIREGMDAAGTDAAAAASAQTVTAAVSREDEAIARLAHELRTPLSAMVAAADIMAGQQLGPLENAQYREYAENIAASGRHALMLVERVLGDWKAPHDGAPLEFVQLDLNVLVRRAVTVLQPIARERGQALTSDLEPGLPHLIADATSLRQILLNLLTNAVKYAKADAEIVVATQSVLDGPVVLSVRDDGPGMSADVLAAARASNARAAQDAAQGSGLGLPLVQRLAAANGAIMTIESSSAGTAIILTFAKDKVIPV
jgi:two-component system cell cycle sensor histidine kinase PleC